MRTLPVLYALRSTDPADARLRELLQRRPAPDQALLDEALQLLRGHAAMDQAREHTRRWAPRPPSCSTRCPTARPRRRCARW